MTQDLDTIIEKLNGELVSAYKNDTALFKKMTAIQRNSGLIYDERPTCPFLRPHLISRKSYNEIARAAETIAEAAERLTYAALEDPQLLDRFDLSDDEARLVRIDPGYRNICNSSRLDTFINGSEFKFLEYNAETPAGVGDQPELENVLEVIPLIKAFLGSHRHWRPQPQKKLLKSLFTSYREFGGRKQKPNIAIIDWEGVPTEAEFHILSDYFESMGFPTLIIDPSEVEYDGEKLHAGSFQIDILYKRVLIHEFLERCGGGHPLVEAYTDGNLCMCNSFRAKIPHKKTSFAILTDEAYAVLFTAGQLEIIRKHIPWTRKLEETKTKFDGREIDLLEFIRADRERFLLKPNDDYGGTGIVFGWESSEAEWESAIENSLADSFIVQERAPISQEVFPVFDSEASLTELLVDFDPFLFQNKVEGGLVRLSSSSLVNVTQGGGQTALIVMEDFQEKN